METIFQDGSFSFIPTSLWEVLGYAALPFGAALLGSLIAAFKTLGPKGRSHLQHLAAGIIFSVVSVEILPDVIHRQHPLLLTIGFCAGVGFMLWLETLSGDHAPTENKAVRRKKLPLTLLAGVSIDVFLDGLLIAMTFHNLSDAGRLLAFALSVELLSVGLTLTQTIRQTDLKWMAILSLNTLVFSMLLLGAVLGIIVLPLLPDPAVDLILSFGLAALLFLVTEELLVESHREVDTHVSTVLFFLGFLVFLLLGQQHIA
ncbi:MAG: ZIP family metal transporter [Methylococcaceae bacterium]|jgi:ZIP family zinc transporter